MPYFFIEMGQAIVADQTLSVTTSGLTGCTFIAGFNKTLKRLGAYHYPADGLKYDEHTKVLEEWLRVLIPSHLILVRGHKCSDYDEKHLMEYILKYGLAYKISINNDAGGVLVTANPKFGVFRGEAMVAKIAEDRCTDVHKKDPGNYHENKFRYQLFGKGVAPGKFKYDVMSEEFPD